MKTLADITPLYDYPQHPMTEAFTALFIHLMLAKSETIKIMTEEIREEFLFKVMEKRLNALNIQVTPTLKILIMMLAENPATVVLYVHALYVMTQERGPGVRLNSDDFCKKFANGFPDTTTLHLAWDSQKDECGINILDTMPRLEGTA